MKKTFITLLALAGLASAAPQALTLTSPTGSFTSDSTLVWSEAYTSLDSWELTFILNATRNDGETIFSINGSTSSANNLIFQKYDGKYQINVDNSLIDDSTSYLGSLTNKDVTITLSYVADVNSEGVLLGSGIFTFKAECGSSQYNGTYTVDDSEIDTSFDAGSILFTNSGNSTISNVKLSKLDNNPIIPEPTTATLSLLALCGLAARRRRK